MRTTRRKGRHTQRFTASGTFVVPANVESVSLIVVGGGGGGQGGISTTHGGGGGGGGGVIRRACYPVTPGASLAVTVGAGGAGGATGSSGFGANGGESSFDAVVRAPGGAGAQSNSSGGINPAAPWGGAGGTDSEIFTTAVTNCGAGGGGGGPLGEVGGCDVLSPSLANAQLEGGVGARGGYPGNNASRHDMRGGAGSWGYGGGGGGGGTAATYGGGTAVDGGGAGAGKGANAVAGTANTGGGGGGGGQGPTAGAAGGSGVVIVEWYEPYEPRGARPRIGPRRRYQLLTASGTWTPPEGVEEVDVLLVGGGGGGGGIVAASATEGGGGGGGGEVRQVFDVPVVPGTPVTVTVGAGGTAGSTAGEWAGNGGLSAFGQLLAGGGEGGRGSAATADPDPLNNVMLRLGGEGGNSQAGDIGEAGGAGGIDGFSTFDPAAARGTAGQNPGSARQRMTNPTTWNRGTFVGADSKGSAGATTSRAAWTPSYNCLGPYGGGGAGGIGGVNAGAWPASANGGGAGGDHANGTAGAANTGGGGGGGGGSAVARTGGAGGSGLVLVSWIEW